MAKVMVSAGEYAAQRGKGFHKWVNEKTASGSEQVLTDTTLYYNLAVGEVVMITCMCFNLETVSDDCSFVMVSCDEVAGGGDATEVSCTSVIYTGASRDENASQERRFCPPVRVAYADGARSISMQIKANDSSAVVSCGWSGYVDLSLGS